MIGDKIIFLPIIGSTNDFLKENFDKFPSGTVVVAEVQTKGRGRNNRTWVSPEGGLWFSILFKPKKKVKPTFFTKAACVAINKALNQIGVENKIKWPNDIYVKAKKLCGILTETIFEGQHPKVIICGIGINVNNQIPEELSDKAVSLSQITGRPHDLKKLLKLLLTKINYIVKKYSTKPEALTRVWKERLMQKEGDEIRFLLDGKFVNGKILEIEDEFIVVEVDGKSLKLFSLDVIVT
ncbi:biotin--[acetyl-CoA-carboxylase] ligase [Pseudothermotoga thermarum]|uniref:Biotin/acetyl-CoA-carboxylase ligase n=1 Tax=Pseudothermotoga thermarum DSM 5069 TaxID=688269 RepID=F7YYE5_9THEM|nr:biotin--[acetyl-CoA-carboxylase] ligase [Pseudothermotoga thermarum]AEH50969.1 biotin/acetyl-CoA-carboxylase ligase [Pseudothermotoga thermarum DSM 5069]